MICKRCKLEKPENQFYGRNQKCNDCLTIAKQKWHFGRRIHIKEYIYRYRKNNPCLDCGVVGDPLIMEFDHVHGVKSFNLAHAFMKSGMTIERVEAEIAKCELRCRNCHAKKTLERSNSWIWQIWQLDQRGELDEVN